MAQDTKYKQEEPPLSRRNRSEAIGRESAALGGDILKRAGFHDPTLVLRWADIAGAEVARLCQPLKLSTGATGGVLTLRAEPGASLFLQHESREICDRINAYLGRQAVSRLRFVQGPLAMRPKSPRSRSGTQVLPPDDPAFAFQGTEAVREALLKLARQRIRRPPD